MSKKKANGVSAIHMANLEPLGKAFDDAVRGKPGRDHQAIARKSAATRKAKRQVELLKELETVNKITRDKRLSRDFPDMQTTAQERLREIEAEIESEFAEPSIGQRVRLADAKLAAGPVLSNDDCQQAIAENAPAKRLTDTRGMLQRFQAMECTLRISPLLTTTGIEFVIVGHTPEGIPPRELSGYLESIGGSYEEAADQFRADYLTASDDTVGF